IAPVRALPGGFLLIAREVFDLLAANGQAPPMVGGTDAPRAFFREMRSGDNLIDLDYAICITYGRCSGEVWLYLDAEIGHIGDDRTAPPFAALLQAIGPGPRQSP
ncbi:MAG: hypothetical protein JWQ36_2933, partial [Enterovirga sp.]|nr:hypothetical protein [Enterovirga sp.]